MSEANQQPAPAPLAETAVTTNLRTLSTRVANAANLCGNGQDGLVLDEYGLAYVDAGIAAATTGGLGSTVTALQGIRPHYLNADDLAGNMPFRWTLQDDAAVLTAAANAIAALP
jgi:hypothetical protein